MSENGPMPELTELGLLPPGVHTLSLEQVGVLFGGFQRSDRRLVLFERLRQYVTALRKTGTALAVVVDGSFVMRGVDEPGDIDLLVVLPQGWDRAAELSPHVYNLLSTS